MGSNTLYSQSAATLQFGCFSDVDATGDPDDYISFLETVERWPHVRTNREPSYEPLEIRPGETALEVGCGAGRAVDELVARGAHAIGIDSSEQMLRTARRRFPQRDFRLGSAELLPLQDSSVHRYRADRLFVHLNDPMAALAEARRVLMPGGRIVLVEPDLDYWAIDADDMAVTRAILTARADTLVYPWFGRRSRALLLDAGFEDVMVEVRTDVVSDYASLEAYLPSEVAPSVSSGLLTKVQADAWLAEQARRGKTNRFFRVFAAFLVSARRP
jgi:ubiquinone/menaquinone biosynthesis C-methylase UbiE